ncbi:MAG: hypothetical protein J4N99_07505 [Chloroflexi bacterium]|nr:hypothetical protein [Chloroflexota bacterium]
MGWTRMANVRIRVLTMVAVILGIATLTGVGFAQSPNTISGPDLSIYEGYSGQIIVTLDADVGISGFRVELALPETGEAAITNAQVGAGFALSHVDVRSATSTLVMAVDLMNNHNAAGAIPIFTVDVAGLNPGSTVLSVSVLKLDDDGGVPITATVLPIGVTVKALPVVHGVKVADLNGDGLAEDINGNGVLDFNDMVLLFQQMGSAEFQNNYELFDWNSNGAIDFNDVVEMFRRAILGN